LPRQHGNQAIHRSPQPVPDKPVVDSFSTASAHSTQDIDQPAVHADTHTRIPSKPRIGAPGVKYEHEADFAAEQVMRMTAPQRARPRRTSTVSARWPGALKTASAVTQCATSCHTSAVTCPVACANTGSPCCPHSTGHLVLTRNRANCSPIPGWSGAFLAFMGQWRRAYRRPHSLRRFKCIP
jgi:hypothetical protein